MSFIGKPGRWNQWYISGIKWADKSIWLREPVKTTPGLSRKSHGPVLGYRRRDEVNGSVPRSIEVSLNNHVQLSGLLDEVSRIPPPTDTLGKHIITRVSFLTKQLCICNIGSEERGVALEQY